MKNNKGFTLVELLATITLLAMLMLIAVPNVISVVNRNKDKTYVEDAKKLISLAEYKIRSDSTYKPSAGQTYCFSMNFLGTGEFDTTAPNGGKYLADKSYVKATKLSDGSISYYVKLVEEKEDATQNKYTGITEEVKRDDLYSDDISNFVQTTDSLSSITSCSGNSSF